MTESKKVPNRVVNNDGYVAPRSYQRMQSELPDLDRMGFVPPKSFAQEVASAESTKTTSTAPKSSEQAGTSSKAKSK